MIRRPKFRSSRQALGGLMLVAIGTGDMAMAQTATKTTTTTTTTAGAVATEPMTQMETLVSRFALYPDDLVALVVPAATYPLQVVDAARYLEKRKANPKLPLPESWDDSVKTLANYPDVIKMMNDDLQWTQALNDAIVTDQAAVLDAVQSYRRKVMAAGNLKTDQRQVVTVEQEVVSIAPADPQVIYVPQYQPTTMVVYGGYSSWGYYGTPYPSYYYPYAPGAALAAGLIWGAAIGAAWNGGRYGYGGGNNNINIDRGDINIDRGDRNNINSGNRGQGGGRGQTWQPSNKASTAGGNRIGDPGARAGASAGNMDRSFGPSTGAGSRGGASANTMDRGAGNRASAGSYGPQAGGSRGASAGTYGPQAGGSRGASAGTYGPQAGGSRGASSSYGGNRSSYGGSSYGGSRGSSAFNSGSYGSRSSASSFSSRGASSRGFSGGGGRRR